MNADLEKAKHTIARVNANGGINKTGTAFYVGNGYVLTVLHVVADTTSKPRVTLLSVGGNYALGKQIMIPFNVTDANIVAHSHAQDQSRGVDSVTLLTQRIQRGLDEMHSPHYLDLPVYAAIRNLPEDRRGIIPSAEGVLVLCPFDESYTSVWQDTLELALGNELNILRKRQGGAILGVSRSFELNSPRLVTQAVYEAIRRAQDCVVDLTYWSPNVLFELGVRLAASSESTACIIDKRWEQKVRDKWQRDKCQWDKWQTQCRSFVSMLVPEECMYDASQNWQQQTAFKYVYGREARHPQSGPLAGELHTLVERALDVEGEPASRPVYQELQDQAALFSRPPGSGGRSKPPSLFPGNKELVQREATADFERLLAAWFYISNRYEPNVILENSQLRDSCYSVIRTLLARHESRLTECVKAALSERRDKINEWRDTHDRNRA